MSAPEATSAFSKDHPFPAKVTENRLLNKAGSVKETRHIVVNLGDSSLSYKAGDSLGVFVLGKTGDGPTQRAHDGACGGLHNQRVNTRQ